MPIPQFAYARAPGHVDDGRLPLDKDQSLSFAAKETFWQSVLEQCNNHNRAEICLSLFKKRLEKIPKDLAEPAAILVWGASTGRDGPDTEGLVTPIQGYRALHSLSIMAPSRKKWIRELLDHATTLAEQAVLLKGVAAKALHGFSGNLSQQHTETAYRKELQELAKAIHGKSEEWLLAHTTCYGMRGAPGLTQSLPNSCGASVRLLAEAEIDPAVALKVTQRRKNKKPLIDAFTKENEKRVLQAFVGIQTGQGTTIEDYIDSAGRGIGEKFVVTADVQKWTAKSRHALLDDLEHRLSLGADVPFRTGDKESGHFLMIVDCKRMAGHRAWRVHDVDDGKTFWCSDKELLSDQGQAFFKKMGWKPDNIYVPQMTVVCKDVLKKK